MLDEIDHQGGTVTVTKRGRPMAMVGPVRRRRLWKSREGLWAGKVHIAEELLTASGLNPHLLLDTHVLVRWLVDPQRLSREQLRVLRDAVRRSEPLALSAITLLEIAVLFGQGSTRLRVPAQELLAALGPG